MEVSSPAASSRIHAHAWEELYIRISLYAVNAYFINFILFLWNVHIIVTIQGYYKDSYQRDNSKSFFILIPGSGTADCPAPYKMNGP